MFAPISTGIASEYTLLQLDCFEGREPVETQTYVTPSNTTLLHVQLWSAGGGDGGASTNASTSGIAGGGGAGGYTEAYISNPSDSYPFLLQVGGRGGYGNNDGEDALPSHFSSPSELLVEGGFGGKSLPAILTNINIAEGGQGGGSNGSFVFLGSRGGTGGNELKFEATLQSRLQRPLNLALTWLWIQSLNP